MKTEKSSFTSGFVSIVGRPNAGKSTLLNQLVGTRVAIVADKPQTTRLNVLGIWNTGDAQVIFVDTPGIHKADTLYNKRMMQEVRNAMEQRDLFLYIADATQSFSKQDQHAIDLLSKVSSPAFLLLNKIDRLANRNDLLSLIERYRTSFDFREIVPISALKGEMLDDLKKLILQYLPQGPAYYPGDQITDQPERFLAAELIREKILRETRQEVPHSVAVLIDLWEEKKNLTSIVATIYVERAGQKGIIIGSGGSMLKQIGTLARKDIEQMLGRKVFLEMFVKVQEAWRESPRFLNELDWRSSPANLRFGEDAGEDGPVVLPE